MGDGNSGAGKSTVYPVLRNRGYVSLDTDDDGFSRWGDRVTGEVVDDLPTQSWPGGWTISDGSSSVREYRPRAKPSDYHVAFLCGYLENEADVRDLFDRTICPAIDDDTLGE